MPLQELGLRSRSELEEMRTGACKQLFEALPGATVEEVGAGDTSVWTLTLQVPDDKAAVDALAAVFSAVRSPSILVGSLGSILLLSEVDFKRKRSLLAAASIPTATS